MAGFYPYRTVGGNTGGDERDFIIEDSATITLGDAIDVTAGYAGQCANSERPMGVCTGFVVNIGQDRRVPIDQDASGTLTGTHSGNAGVIGSETYVTAADNITVDQIMARVQLDPMMEYYNDADSTLTQAEVGTYFDTTSDGDQITGAGATATEGSNNTGWILTEIDPFNDSDASKGVFLIAKTQLRM